MASRYRPSPPPYGRRIVVPERSSTGTFSQPNNASTYDPYYSRDRRESYTSPRTSGERVIPVSTETYRNGSLVSSNRPGASYDPYNDPRRSSLTAPDAGQRRLSHQPLSSASAVPSRLGPTVIHQNLDRPGNGSTRESDRHDRGSYYVTPASSSGRRQHRKTYSIDDSRRARLVDDPDRDSDYVRETPRREPRYHLTGPSTKRSNGDADDDDDYPGYEYATPRDIFENTEPRRQTRRRGSVDAPSRDRPTGLMGSYPQAKPRPKEIGPPPATRGLEKISNGGGITRHESARDPARTTAPYSERKGFESHSEDDDYYVAPRRRRDRPEPAYYDRDAPYSPTRSDFDERRHSLTSSRKFEDADVANRGFGIRPPSADTSRSREGSVESRSRYGAEQRPPPPPPDYPVEARRGDRYRDPDHRQQWDRASDVDREVEAPRRMDRDRERDRYPEEDVKTREKHVEDESEPNKHDKPRDDRRKDGSSIASIAMPTVAAGTAAYAAHELSDRKGAEENRSRGPEPKERDTKAQGERRIESPDETFTRERHYVTRDDQRDTGPAPADDTSSMDPDEEFRLRVQQEASRAKQPKAAASRQNGEGVQESRENAASDSVPHERRHEGEHHQPRAVGDEDDDKDDDDDDDDDDDGEEGEEDTSRALAVRPESHRNILDAPLTDEPVETIENRDNRVRIVEPAKEKEAPRGILRKPTEKFPEYDDNIREGVAPHKNSKKEGIPEGARWTKISRLIVNPQALQEADERFEEREEHVIVLRAISKEEIQKLADRTQEIREEREHRHHHHRDRRHRRRGHEERDEDEDYEDR